MTVVQAQAAAVLATQVTELTARIAVLQTIVDADNRTIASVLIRFNETPIPLLLDNDLTQADTTALLSAGIAILQGYLTTAQAALAAI